MTSKLLLSSSISSATLVAINSISAATVAADDKQNHHAAVVVAAVTTDDPLKDVSVEQDEITSAFDNAEREGRLFTPKSSTAAMKPDVGILSKDFFKNKGREQPIGQQLTIHRKKRASAADVDVGILRNGRRQQQKPFDKNLHAMNEVTGRSHFPGLSLPYMCPNETGRNGLTYFDRLFDETDGYFPKCACPSPTTCGPVLCECLELDADGDILQCMDPLKQLCEGTKYIDGIPGPWSMEECLGDDRYGGCLGSKRRAIEYCSMLPCFVDGGSIWQCKCNTFDRRCTEYKDKYSCARSKCCQAQTDDEGREACNDGYGYIHENYYDQVTSFSISWEEMTSRFNECSFNSDSDKSIVQCYCESFSYGLCVNNGVADPNFCEAMNCCFEQTEDNARLDCFTTRFRDTWWTGLDFYRRINWKNYYHYGDEIQESCVASGRSSDQCKCDIQGLSNCVYGIDSLNREPRCDLFQCCQSQTGDEGRKDCLVQDEARLVQFEAEQKYGWCINVYGNTTTESCICDKSNSLCSSGHSDARHCELSSCCQEQADDTGRKECIANFTTSQPSSAPSETPTEDSIHDAEASPTAAIALSSTPSASISTPLGVKSLTKTTSKMLAVTAVIGWLLFS